jgi:hypothetical protein
LKLTRAAIVDIFRDWCAAFRIFFDSVRNLLFDIVVKDETLRPRPGASSECSTADSARVCGELSALTNVSIGNRILRGDSVIVPI